MTETKTAVERRIDSLLRGEIAAAETYKIVLEKLEDGRETTVLRSIQEDHGDAIRFLYGQLTGRGTEPSAHSGPFGAFARGVEGAAAKLGDKAALMVLREGEVRGLRSYENALREAVLPGEAQLRVSDTFVPRQRRHIEELTRLIDAS